MTKEMERLKEIEDRKAALREEIAKNDADEARLTAITEEAEALSKEENEIRSKIALNNILAPQDVPGQGEERTLSEREARAQEFAKTGRMEVRALLSTGTIAKPSEVGGINGLAEIASGIVDDVHAIPLTGNGSWTAAYKTAEAEAAAVTDGQTIGGTGATFNYVTISPSEWGVLDSISKQVAKMTPLDYQAEIEKSALIALRKVAADKIVYAIGHSSIAENKTSVALDADYLRKLALGFRAIEGKGDVRLYLNQADLLTLGKVRGTNEKKALYEIEFDPGTTTSGTIREGGLAVKFRVLDQLGAGVQFFGQPGAVDMPMWDNYKVETDEGGVYFQKNLIGIRGLQTANADLVAYHGMQVIAQGNVVPSSIVPIGG